MACIVWRDHFQMMYPNQFYQEKNINKYFNFFAFSTFSMESECHCFDQVKSSTTNGIVELYNKFIDSKGEWGRSAFISSKEKQNTATNWSRSYPGVTLDLPTLFWVANEINSRQNTQKNNYITHVSSTEEILQRLIWSPFCYQ